MHAEATSEKVGDGLASRRSRDRGASAPTRTCRPRTPACCPGGTAYITDVGMTGPRGGVIGVKREQALASLVTQMPIRFETSTEDPWLNGVLIRSRSRCAQLDRAGARAGAGGRVDGACVGE